MTIDNKLSITNKGKKMDIYMLNVIREEDGRYETILKRNGREIDFEREEPYKRIINNEFRHMFDTMSKYQQIPSLKMEIPVEIKD